MSKAFYFILALAIAGGSLAITNPFDLPLVYAQTVTTKGNNYDLIEDFTIGEAKWTSHPERIMVNGEWENYFLQADNQKIIFRSNSVGGFIYDIPSCSYSIYENGFTGNQIIPSVSAVATKNVNGQWQNMEVNNESCDVTFTRNLNGIEIFSTKTLTENFNIQTTNGTITTNSTQTEKFVQELKVDIFGGIKETFKVWNESNEPLGISQTVHTGDSITVGNNELNISQYNGQSFDKQFLEDNQAQVFEIANNLNYDFDLGFDSLTGINIISESGFFSSTNKVNLDYADGGFVNYLEIDPTLTTTGSGTFDVSPIWEHTISSGTIDGTPLTSTQITNLQNDLNAQNQYHTLSGTTLVVSYTVSTSPDSPTNLQTVTGIPIEVSWTAPVDDGGSALTGYKVYRTLNQYVMTELPNNGGTTGVDFTDNELLLHGESFGGQPDYSDDFSTDTNWTKTGTLIDVEPTTNKRLDFTASTNGAIHGEVWDLGSTLSNSNWILRYKLDLTTVSNSGDANTKRFWFGLDSTSGMDSTTANHYFTGMYLQKGNSGEYIRLTTRENANLDDSLGTATSVSLSSNTQYWIEIKRTSSTSVTLSVYSDSDYSTLVNSVSRTLTNMNNLQYLKAVNSKTSTPSTATLTGFIDDVKLYDGVTSVPTPTATDNSPNTLTVTANSGTTTTGVISNAISTPDLEVTSSLLPDGTDDFTIGSWVKQTATPTNTKLLGFTNSNGEDVAFNVGTTTADFKVNTTPIISATGLTDNTSAYHHYALTRDGSSWTLYQDGSSVATATDSTDLGSPSGQTSLVYDQQTNNNNQSLYSGVQHISAERFGTGSSIVGQKITNVSLLLAIHSGSPTGTATVGAFDSNGNTLFTFDTIDVTTLTGTPTWYDFTNNSGYTVQTDDYIGIKYTGGDSNNRINTFLDYLNNPFEGTTSYWGRYAVTTWQDYTTSDLTMKLTATNDPVYSINLDGSIDEYFIDSTALSSNEIETVYGMGSEPTQIATTGTTPEYDDSGVTPGNTYYYYVKATNAIGDSDFSVKATGIPGTPPNPPTSVTASITNVNTNPLDVLIQWSAPTYVGTGTLTGFEIVRDGSVVATVGLVTSYTDTVPSAGTYSYLVRAISTHGTSSDSNTSNITTPTEPSAINNLSATVNSDTVIALSWSSPNNGGSSITLFKVFQDAVQIDTTTNTSYTVTGLSPNTSYDFTVVASNNVGDSTASNTATETTYLEITGQIDLTATTQGSTTQFVFSANVTAGTPTPTFSTFDIIENGITIASNISSPYNLKLTDTATHTYTIISTDNTHWNTPSINGTVSGITASYQADWQTDLLGTNEIAYDLTRANDQLNLVVNRDTGTSTWHLNCNYRTNTQILAGNNGTWYEVNSWYYDDTQSISDASIVYIDCYNDDVILQITSYSSDRTGGGIAVLNGFFEDWTGTPVALFFVLLVAGLFSGRTAPTGILLMLAIVGVMGFVGLLVIDEVIWAFILLVGVLGLFVGKRFL